MAAGVAIARTDDRAGTGQFEIKLVASIGHKPSLLVHKRIIHYEKVLAVSFDSIDVAFRDDDGGGAGSLLNLVRDPSPVFVSTGFNLPGLIDYVPLKSFESLRFPASQRLPVDQEFHFIAIGIDAHLHCLPLHVLEVPVRIDVNGRSVFPCRRITVIAILGKAAEIHYAEMGGHAWPKIGRRLASIVKPCPYESPAQIGI